MITMQTNLSVLVAVTKPAGGEMSGLTAHFLFGVKAAPIQRHNPGQTLRQKDRQTGGVPDGGCLSKGCSSGLGTESLVSDFCSLG
jgi:hypothetical protein